jgi:hypothetical protein
MRKQTIFLIGILLSQLLLAQKLEKYEDALPRILNSPSSGIAASLQRYLIEDPENHSIYFQLGVVYYDRYQNSDILTDYRYKYGNAQKALNNMTIARARIDEKEIKRNDEHYLNFGHYDSRGRLTVSLDTIQAIINNSLVDVQAFVDNAPPIYESFTQSFSHYDKAHKLYTDLIGQYQTVNDLYLLYDEEMDKTFEEISSEYTKALKAFENYKAATDSFSIGYNQELAIQDLKVYRLDGLSSEINFLIPEIHIWNYAKWVEETRSYIKENIDALRLALGKEELRINDEISSAQSDFIREEFSPLDVSKEVLFTLRKFDLQSVIEPLFLYKEAKHDLIHKQLQGDELARSEESDPSRVLYLYGELVNKVRKADTLLLAVRTRNTRQTHEKYASFLQTHYGGRAGINEYARGQSDELAATQQTYVDKIVEGVYQQLNDSSELQAATYRRTTLPLNTSRRPSMEELTNEAVTILKLKNFDGSLFIGGVKKNQDSLVVTYVSGITPEGKVGWYNEYELKLDSGQVAAHTRLATMEAVPGGCAMILHVSNPEFPEVQNQLIILDESGQEQLNQPLDIKAYPQSITYNDRNNSMLLAFSGRDHESDVYESGQLILARYNILGERLWQQSIAGRIEMIDAITTLDGFVAIGNFAQYRAPDGRMIRAGRETTDIGVFALAIDNNGEISKMINLDLDTPTYATHLFKVSEDCINILGSTNQYEPDGPLDTSDKATFFMINHNLVELARKP